MLIDKILIGNKFGNRIKEICIKKYHYDDWVNINNFSTKYGFENLKWVNRVFNYMFNITEIPKCICGNSLNFRGRIDNIYTKYCSNKCSSNSNVDDRIKTLKSNNLKKYGVENVFQLDLVKQKSKDTCLLKYGVDNPNKSKSIREKIYATNLERYGEINPSYSQSIKDKISISIKNSRVLNTDKNNEFADRWGLRELIYRLDGKYEFTCESCKEKQIMDYHLIYNRIKLQSVICLKCNPLYSTFSQNELSDYISTLTTNIEIDRRFGKGIYTKKDYEIDIYLPDFKLGFEYNGIYWHSEFYKSKNYHLEKKEYFNSLGINIIQIWEDDWKYKRDIIKSIILNKIGKNFHKIYARNCDIRIVSNVDCKLFLELNHLQGYTRSSINIGLYNNDMLVSLMTFGKRKINNKDQFELIRFCNKLNTTVVGSASKLFKYFLKNYNFNQVVSYSNNDISNGDLYKKLGFTNTTDPTINYYWCDNKKRYHRYNFNKRKLIKDGYDDSKTEVEIMHENGYYRIFGSGNLKWIFNNI